MNQYLIFLGPPSSGKGTQAQNLAKKLNYEYFSSGDAMREEIKTGSKISQYFSQMQAKGKIEDDEQLRSFIKSKILFMISKPDFEGIVLDGFPRTIGQIEVLNSIIPVEKFSVINIEVDKDQLIERVAKRKVCTNCKKIFIDEENKLTKCDVCGGQIIQRPDDNPIVFAQRLNEYAKLTEPIIDILGKSAKMININGNPPIDEVAKEIRQKINE